MSGVEPGPPIITWTWRHDKCGFHGPIAQDRETTIRDYEDHVKWCDTIREVSA